MDALDLRILRALGVQAWAPRDRSPESLRPTTLARRFGVRVDLVRERIARLESQGVIAGYEVYPNFRHLGLHLTTYHYRLPEEGLTAAAVDEAADFEGVCGVYGYLGPQVCVDICYRSEADRLRRMDVLGRLMGGAEGRAFWERTLPRVDRDLDRLDWQIIQALRGDARRPLEDVAADLDISARTARRRHARLVAEQSIDIIPNVDPTCIDGNLMVEFHLRLRPDAPADTRDRVMALAEDHWFTDWAPPDASLASSVVIVVGPSIQGFESLRERIEAVPGVASVRVLVPSRTVYRGQWIDEAIQERIAAFVPATA